MARRGTSHLSVWAKPVERGKKWREKKMREKREEKKRREKLLIFSSFPGDPAVGVCQSKRQSSSSWRELQVETKIGEFLLDPRKFQFSKKGQNRNFGKNLKFF